MCGRINGYQVASPDGFLGNDPNINQIYLDGVSITHGTQRTHIWSYVAGYNETSICPCSDNSTNTPPSFVGNDYYCESGNPTDQWSTNQFFVDDLLWDGQQCEGTCCNGTNSPPWFCVQLPAAPTLDRIEVRICGDEPTYNEDTPIELLEIYIQ